MARAWQLDALQLSKPLPTEQVYAWKDVVYAKPCEPGQAGVPSVRAAPVSHVAIPRDVVQQLSSAELHGWVSGGPLPMHASGMSAHPKHRLDVFIPKRPFPRDPLPMLLVVHGGGWWQGDRQYTANPAMYQNVGIAAAHAGFVAAVMSYRLAPLAAAWDWLSSSLGSWATRAGAPAEVAAHSPPVAAQLDDVAAAVAWCSAHASRFGGDASRLAVLGHSAGGHLSMMQACQPGRVQAAAAAGSPGPAAISAVVSVSGVLNVPRLAGTPLAPVLTLPAFGESAAAARKYSPVHLVSRTSPAARTPMLLLNAADDAHLEQDAAEFERALVGQESEPQVWGERPPAAATPSTPWSQAFQGLLQLSGDQDVATRVAQRPPAPSGNTPRSTPSLVTRALAPGRNHMSIIGAFAQPGDVVAERTFQWLHSVLT